jgi:hypothetical protein
MHWRRFCACLEALPVDQADRILQTVQVEMAAFLCGQTCG